MAAAEIQPEAENAEELKLGPSRPLTHTSRGMFLPGNSDFDRRSKTRIKTDLSPIEGAKFIGMKRIFRMRDVGMTFLSGCCGFDKNKQSNNDIVEL